MKMNYYLKNRTERLKYQRHYYRQNRQKCLEYQRKYKYGISQEEYNQLFDKQEGKCFLCGKHQSELRDSLCVDHDHKTGEIRGLLCKSCNMVLGKFEDDLEVYYEKKTMKLARPVIGVMQL